MFSIGLLAFAYFFFVSGNFIFYVNGRAITFKRSDTPLPYYAATTAMLLLGLILGSVGVRKVIRLVRGTEPRSTRVETSPTWIVLNVALGISAAVVSAAFSTASVPPIGAPLILATAIFVLTIVLAIATVRRADAQTLLQG